MTTRGRKQYRYHPDFRDQAGGGEVRPLPSFGKALPKLRRRVDADLQEAQRSSRDTVVAAVVRLLDTGRIRVGNEAYAKDNKSYRRDHLAQPPRQGRRPHGQDALQGEERRSSAKLTITDRTLSRVVRQLPGPARPEPVPISERRRRAAPRHLDRRQRLYPRGDRRRFHRQAFPHLERERDRLRADLLEPSERGVGAQDDARAGRRGARQHGRDEPQVLCPSGAASTRSRSARATGSDGNGPPRDANVCRPREVGLLAFPRQAKPAQRKPQGGLI